MSSQHDVQSLLRPGDRLGKYVIDRCIGIGGMGEVYLVHHAHGHMPFALKLIKPAIMREDPVFCERFLREARLASRFQHPGSIEVNDAELDAGSGILYLVMEYVDGMTLRESLDRTPPYSRERHTKIVNDIVKKYPACASQRWKLEQCIEQSNLNHHTDFSGAVLAFWEEKKKVAY